MLREFLISFFLHIIFFNFLLLKKEREKFSLSPTVFYMEFKEIEGESKFIEKAPEEPQVVEKVKEFKKVSKKKEQKKEVKKESLKELPLKGGGKAKINLDMPYSYYFDILLRKIAENWSYGHVNRDTLRTTIFFVILKDGSIKDIKIEKTSGNTIFDQSAYRAVVLTKKVPPLPIEMNMEFLRVYLEFEVP